MTSSLSRAALAAAVALGTACARREEAPPATSQARAPVAAAAPSAPRARPRRGQPADDARLFSERAVILMTASEQDIADLRARLPENEFYTVADDMNWYRAKVYEYVEKRGLPLLQLTGRRPLEFVVGNGVRRLDSYDPDLLDVLVVYEPGREPLVLAPIEVDSVGRYLER